MSRSCQCLPNHTWKLGTNWKVFLTSQSNAALICVGDYWGFFLFFLECLSSFFSRLQRLDFVRCLMGQASLKQLWFGLVCCSTSVDGIILLRRTGFICLSDDWSLLHPLPDFMRTTSCSTSCRFCRAFYSLCFSCRRKNASNFLGSPSWPKIIKNVQLRCFAEGSSLPYITESACLNDACNN